MRLKRSTIFAVLCLYLGLCTGTAAPAPAAQRGGPVPTDGGSAFPTLRAGHGKDDVAPPWGDGPRSPMVPIPLPQAYSQAVPFMAFGNGHLIRSAPRRDPAEASAGTITLNLQGVPVAQAARTVLGDIMGANYMVDPRLNGTVTVQTTQPITKAAALDLLQAALLPDGGTVIKAGGIFKVVPVDLAATGSITTNGAPVSSLDGTGFRVVSLRYVAASEMARLLEPIVPKGTIVEADDARNILALRGSAASLRAVLDTVASFDVDVMRGMSFGIVPVKTKQPERMVEDLKAIFASDKDGPLKGRVRFLANGRIGAVLVVTSEPSYLALAQDWIRRLDAQREGSEPELHIYPVQNRPARELAKVLQAMFGDDTAAAGVTGSLVAPRSAAAAFGLAATAGSAGGMGSGGMGSSSGSFSPGGFGGGMGSGSSEAAPAPGAAAGWSATGSSPGSARNARAAGAGGTGLAGGGSAATGGDGADAGRPTTAVSQPRLKIVADDVKNALLIMADRNDYRRILKVVRSMDVVASQVMIQAAVAEVTLNDQLQYGVQWQLQKDGHAARTSFTDAAKASVAAVYPGFNYAMNVGSIASTLSALNAITHVNVISTPSLMVLDSKTAALQIGDQVPITTQTATSTVTTNGAIVNAVEMRDTGVILSVTPRINESGRIQLDIEQEVSAVVQTTSSNIDSPTIQQRRVKTTVVVKDGEVLALGGMIQSKVEKDSSEIPFLGQIPGIGAAFASRNHRVSKTELIILITPRIVRDTVEARRVTEDYRRDVHAYAAPESDDRGMANTARRMLEHP